MITSLMTPRLEGLLDQLAVQWPGGRLGTSNPAVLLRFRDRLPLLLLASGRIGALAEAYVDGRVDIEGSLRDVMSLAARLADDPIRDGERNGLVHRWHAFLGAARARLAGLALRRDRANVSFHYDLSDEFFALWLDPKRVYSCAYYRDPDMDLAQAQEAKLEHLCAKLRLRPGQRLLDVGAGWGGLLLWAARHHRVRALGITLSRNQHAHVQRLIEAHGLQSQVEVRLAHYQSLDERAGFDRIASVGMFEHVGRANLVRYFGHLRQLLRPGGLLLNHGITAGGPDNRELGAGIGGFIERHIFPGGELVHAAQAAEAIARGGLELVDLENLRPHYARTLWAWSDSLERHLVQARALTSEAAVRAYRMYLAGSALAFEKGWLSLHQFLAARPDGADIHRRMTGSRSDYPFQRHYMYPSAQAGAAGSGLNPTDAAATAFDGLPRATRRL